MLNHFLVNFSHVSRNFTLGLSTLISLHLIFDINSALDNPAVSEIINFIAPLGDTFSSTVAIFITLALGSIIWDFWLSDVIRKFQKRFPHVDFINHYANSKLREIRGYEEYSRNTDDNTTKPSNMRFMSKTLNPSPTYSKELYRDYQDRVRLLSTNELRLVTSACLFMLALAVMISHPSEHIVWLVLIAGSAAVFLWSMSEPSRTYVAYYNKLIKTQKDAVDKTDRELEKAKKHDNQQKIDELNNNSKLEREQLQNLESSKEAAELWASLNLTARIKSLFG